MMALTLDEALVKIRDFFLSRQDGIGPLSTLNGGDDYVELLTEERQNLEILSNIITHFCNHKYINFRNCFALSEDVSNMNYDGSSDIVQIIQKIFDDNRPNPDITSVKNLEIATKFDSCYFDEASLIDTVSYLVNILYIPPDNNKDIEIHLVVMFCCHLSILDYFMDNPKAISMLNISDIALLNFSLAKLFEQASFTNRQLTSYILETNRRKRSKKVASERIAKRQDIIKKVLKLYAEETPEAFDEDGMIKRPYSDHTRDTVLRIVRETFGLKDWNITARTLSRDLKEIGACRKK